MSAMASRASRGVLLECRIYQRPAMPSVVRPGRVGPGAAAVSSAGDVRGDDVDDDDEVTRNDPRQRCRGGHVDASGGQK